MIKYILFPTKEIIAFLNRKPFDINNSNNLQVILGGTSLVKGNTIYSVSHKDENVDFLIIFGFTRGAFSFKIR